MRSAGRLLPPRRRRWPFSPWGLTERSPPMKLFHTASIHLPRKALIPGHFGRQHFANVAILSPISRYPAVCACHLYSSHRERTWLSTNGGSSALITCPLRRG